MSKIIFRTEEIWEKQNKKRAEGQLNSECIYEVIVSPKMPTKNLKDSQFSIQPTFSLSLAFFELHRKKNLKLFSTKSKIIDSS